MAVWWPWNAENEEAIDDVCLGPCKPDSSIAMSWNKLMFPDLMSQRAG